MIIDPVPVRLQILKALTETIRTVTPQNGFQMDLSTDSDGVKRVIRGRLFVGDDDPDVLVSIIEPPSAVEQIRSKAPDNTARAGEWDVLVQGWTRNDDDNDECDLAYVLAAEVQRVLGQEKARKVAGRPGYPNFLGMGDTILEFRIGAPVVRPTEEVTDRGVFYLILTMKIVEDTAGPIG